MFHETFKIRTVVFQQIGHWKGSHSRKFFGFHFKTKFKPAIVDHNTKPIDNNVWGGSILRCNYKPAGYYVAGTGLGCTLRLTGVQVKKLVEGQLGTAGFTEVEPEVNHENY